MNERKFNEIVEFFNDELACNEKYARKLAGYVDNIVFNARMEDNDAFIYAVAFGIRNAYWDGQVNCALDDDMR